MAIVPAALVLLIGAQAVADESRVIQIRVDGVPEFDVVYHRARTNAIGVAIGGLIGAGIQAGIESDMDASKREALKPHVSEQIWNDAFLRTLDEVLRTKGFDPEWVEGQGSAEAAKADVYLVLFPASYGFRMVDSTTALVSAYVEFKAIYMQEPIKPRTSPPKELFYMTDKRQVSYDELVNETSALNVDLESVLGRAARRLANKMIYNLE